MREAPKCLFAWRCSPPMLRRGAGPLPVHPTPRESGLVLREEMAGVPPVSGCGSGDANRPPAHGEARKSGGKGQQLDASLDGRAVRGSLGCETPWENIENWPCSDGGLERQLLVAALEIVLVVILRLLLAMRRARRLGRAPAVLVWLALAFRRSAPIAPHQVPCRGSRGRKVIFRGRAFEMSEGQWATSGSRSMSPAWALCSCPSLRRRAASVESPRRWDTC